MSTNELIPTLAFVTIGLVLVIAIVMAINFFRKRRNRDAMMDHGVVHSSADQSGRIPKPTNRA